MLRFKYCMAGTGSSPRSNLGSYSHVAQRYL